MQQWSEMQLFRGLPGSPKSAHIRRRRTEILPTVNYAFLAYSAENKKIFFIAFCQILVYSKVRIKELLTFAFNQMHSHKLLYDSESQFHLTSEVGFPYNWGQARAKHMLTISSAESFLVITKIIVKSRNLITTIMVNLGCILGHS